jgi:hypothetical protein
VSQAENALSCLKM